jgi:hypothetical protein
MGQVLWTESALDELAALWLEADSVRRQAITAAQAEIDRLLENSPDDVGESRPNHRRVAFVPPLGVVFSVQESNKAAKVLRIWTIPGRSSAP